MGDLIRYVPRGHNQYDVKASTGRRILGEGLYLRLYQIAIVNALAVVAQRPGWNLCGGIIAVPLLRAHFAPVKSMCNVSQSIRAICIEVRRVRRSYRSGMLRADYSSQSLTRWDIVTVH